MRFEVADEIWSAFAGMRIAVAVARGLDNTGEKGSIGTALDGAWARAGALVEGHGNAQSHPHVRPWREAFSGLGVSGNRFPTSIEALLRRAMKGGPPPRINPLVDLYNAISLDLISPVGGFDLTELKGDLRLGFTEGGETFLALDATEAVRVDPGEVAYMTGAVVLTRHLAWRQSREALLTPDSREVVLLSEVAGSLPDSLVDSLLTSFSAAVREHFRVEVTTQVVHEGNPLVSLTSD